ncbi:hypothetical protein [Methylobacterium radiotolerans]|uniref:hypothetical protein n=1 Tax=Methylobacterium radiotolerans TaxID=31998 RepID=UPI0015F3800C|nr:hypothetical protein [Methylobacterium radiotolerans]
MEISTRSAALIAETARSPAAQPHICAMTLQIDFTHDVAARCIERLTEAGYAPAPADDEEAIYTYVSIRHRRVRPQPRTVHKAAYTVPAHLAVGEQQLLEKVKVGGDLWPHQSRKIGKLSVEDGMLNDYGIQHFHLGTTPDAKRPDLITGTKELLFAVVKEGDFYAIGIYDHDAWTKQALVDVIHATWPELTEPYTLKDGPGMKVLGLAYNPTDEEVASLRAAGVNALQQRPDGKIQIGMGGGVASDGSSFAVRREADRLLDHIDQLQTLVEDGFAPVVASGKLPPNAQVRVIWEDEKAFVVTKPPSTKDEITSHLIIPPL